jgi:hypothetical protein
MIQQQLLLNEEEIHSLFSNEEVQGKLRQLRANENISQIVFFIERDLFTNTIVDKLIQCGITADFIQLPLRWIRGDLSSHVDIGGGGSVTNIVYLSDSDGSLVVDNESFEIKAGMWYQFAEGTSHQTIDTSGERLLLGPMSNQGIPVGAGSAITYYTDSSLETSFDYTFYLGIPVYFYDGSIVPPEYIPSGVTFGGWIIAYHDPTDFVYEVGQIVAPESVYETYCNYSVYPYWIRSFIPRLHFSDNSMVFYKQGSLASGGVNTVTNSRAKSRRT